jgi:hypothetical protein
MQWGLCFIAHTPPGWPIRITNSREAQRRGKRLHEGDVFIDKTVDEPVVVGIVQPVPGEALITFASYWSGSTHNDRPVAVVGIRFSFPMMIKKVGNRQQDGARLGLLGLLMAEESGV